MTIIMFLMDTSASMNQRTYLGTAKIDIAKGAVESFMKLRARDLNSRWDRYMLLTFESPPSHIKAGWKENHATLMTELRNIQATGMTSMGPALKNALDLLNLNRMQTGVDTYGAGRVPFYLEPAVIIVITDGDKMTHESTNVSPELHLPMTGNSFPGEDLCKEPFRWDQRIFSLVLKFPASVPPENGLNMMVPPSSHPIENMCEVTGGRSYAVSNVKSLNVALESLVSKVMVGVVLRFERVLSDSSLYGVLDEALYVAPDEESDTTVTENGDGNQMTMQGLLSAPETVRLPAASGGDWQKCRKLAIVPRSAQKGGYYQGHWPIPEAYWPDLNSPTLPARDAQPIVQFSMNPVEVKMPEGMPFDKYEVEPCALTRVILDKRQTTHGYRVFVPRSGRYETVALPFGYLKASSNLNGVSLFVLPYNYPLFLTLIEDLRSKYMGKVTHRWKAAFDTYLRDVPPYYIQSIKRALGRMQLHEAANSIADVPLNYNVSANLKKYKNQAKVECDRQVASVGQKIPPMESFIVEPRSKTSILQSKDFNQLLQNSSLAGMAQNSQDFSKFSVALKSKSFQPQYFRNAYDIPRNSLLDQSKRMLSSLIHTKAHGWKYLDEDQEHSVPVQQMGNYQEYLKKQPLPLRELESQPVRLHTFGNPFKVKQDMMIDEADDASFMGQNAQRRRPSTPLSPMGPGGRRRRPGPLSRDVPMRRPSSPHPGSMSPMSSSESIGMDSDSENELMIVDEEREEGAEDLMNGGEQQENYGFENPAEMAPARAVAPRGLSEKKLAQLCSHNRKLKVMVFKEVKRPGRNHKNLFTHLKCVQGGLEARRAFIREIILEANRFKRKPLIKQLEEFLRTMQGGEAGEDNVRRKGNPPGNGGRENLQR